MVQARLKSSKVSDPKVLVGLSVFLALIGGMVIDPLAGFICFLLAGIFLVIASFKGRGWNRYIAILLLLSIIYLAVSKFSEAAHHIRVYKSKTVTGDIK